jgi:hypothetical protein
MDKEKVITNMEMMTTKASVTTETVTATFADGMTTTKTIFPQDSLRKTGCRRGWKNSLCGAASFHLGSRNGSNRAPKTLNGGYPLPLRIASTS